jgi:hypothetical protein
MKHLKMPSVGQRLESRLQGHFNVLARKQAKIKLTLDGYADGKPLKGDEIVGWLGEVYTKLLLRGELASDDLDYDVKAGNKRVSVKARKGNAKGWNRTSSIPRVAGTEAPTHLAFLHFDSCYRLRRAWLYPWEEIRRAGRFKKHIVRGQHRAYVFNVSLTKDKRYVCYESRDLQD